MAISVYVFIIQTCIWSVTQRKFSLNRPLFTDPTKVLFFSSQTYNRLNYLNHRLYTYTVMVHAVNALIHVSKIFNFLVFGSPRFVLLILPMAKH